MSAELQVAVRALVPTPQGVGVFLTDGKKTIAIFVDPFVASAISMFAEGARSPRPLTHELMVRVLAGLGARVQKVVINDLKGDTFFARLHLVRENGPERHYVEIDARPSDSIALAMHQKCPIFVRGEVWKQAADMTWALEQAEAALDEERRKRDEGKKGGGGAPGEDPGA